MLEPRTDWAETIPPNEEAELLGLAETIREIQRRHSRKAGPGRGLHRKSHTGARAELRTRGDLPAPYRVGIFATEGAYMQLYVDPQRTPIEDGSADWSEADSPYVPVADLTLQQQDTTSEQGRRVEELLERVSFDPWHAPVEFRPLGNLMRARGHAYRLSAIERAVAAEPDGSETFA